MKSLPRYLFMVFAFAGDSTMTSERAIVSVLTPDLDVGRPCGEAVCPSRLTYMKMREVVLMFHPAILRLAKYIVINILWRSDFLSAAPLKSPSPRLRPSPAMIFC